MDKRMLIAVLAFIAGMVFIGAVLAQENFPTGVFSGKITKVDQEKREFVVQNKDGEKLFGWDHETWIDGAPGEKEGLISDNLKEGMLVTIVYMKVDMHRVASRIEVETSSVGILKGWETPFGCGLSLC
jgi:hypothetical protein